MKFKEGESGNPAGRPPGAVNILTKTVKQTVLEVFQRLQEDPNHSLEAFARKFPRDYYQIAAKLIPTEVKSEVTLPEGLKLVFNPAPNCDPLPEDGKAD